MIHRFAAFEADAGRFELRCQGRPVPVQRRVLETILFLATSGGRLITRAELLDGPWRGTIVSDAAFKQAIMHARRALLDPEHPHSFIVTVHGKGFRWVNPETTTPDRHSSPSVVGAHSALVPAVGAKAKCEGHGVTSVREAVDAAGAMLGRVEKYADPLRILDAQALYAQLLMDYGAGHDFKRVAEQHGKLARQVDHPGHVWHATLMAGAQRYAEGHLQASLRLLSANAQAGRRCVGPSARGIVASHFLNLALEATGQARRRLFRASERLALRHQPAPAELQLLAAVARLHLGDTPGARQLFDECSLDIARLPDDRHLLASLVNWIDLAIAFGNTKDLEIAYRRLEPHAGLRVARDLSDWGPVTYHLGRVARSLGDAANSRRLLERARVESKAARSRCWHLWAGYACARALHEGGSPRERWRARQLLTRVLTSARCLQLPALADAVTSYRP